MRCGGVEAAAAAVGNLNYKALESNFFFSLYFFYYKLKDIFLRYQHYLLLVYLLILLINLLNQCINPELPNLYIIEDNKASSSSNVDSSSNVETSNTKIQYKGVAASLHDQIADIDKKLSKLTPESPNYVKEKEALLDERESLTDHMTLLNQYKSTRANDSYVPQSSENKRVGDNSLTVTSSSKRSRD